MSIRIRWWWILIRLGWMSLKRHGWMFGLGMVCVTLIVAVVASGLTLTRFAPIIVARLGELQVGEIDVLVESASREGNRSILNYTAAAGRWSQLGSQYGFHTPRLVVPAVAAGPAGTYYSTLRAIWTQREQSIGLGSMWPFGPIRAGGCVIPKRTALELDVRVGDTILVAIDLYSVLASQATAQGEDTKSLNFPLIPISLTVDAILDRFYGKFDVSEDEAAVGIVVELDTLPEVILREEARLESLKIDVDALRTISFRELTTQIILNLPPPRDQTYRKSDFQLVQSSLVQFSSEGLSGFATSSIQPSLPLLQQIESNQYLLLFLGLLVNVAMVMFFLLSFVIVFSLLLFNAENRRVEVGILRLLGMARTGVAELVLVQIAMISVPSWLLGLGVAQLAIVVAFRFLSGLAGLHIPSTLPPKSVAIGTAAGLVLPLISGLLPLRRALTFQPNEPFKRSRLPSGVRVSIVHESPSVPPLVLFAGFVTTAFGVLIYYAFPYALIANNLTVLLNIFVILLITMLLCQVSILANFDRIFTQFTSIAFFFWEKPHVRQLARMNLISHRERNRKTFMVYSLAIALIVYLSSSITAQIEATRSTVQRVAGGEVRVLGSLDNSSLDPFTCCKRELEEVLRMSDSVSCFTWVPQSFNAFIGPSVLRNIGGTFASPVQFFGMFPFFDECVFKEFSSWDAWTLATPTVADLFSVEGSQQIFASAFLQDGLGLERGIPVAMDFGTKEPLALVDILNLARAVSGIPSSRLSFPRLAIGSVTTALRFGAQANLGSIDDLPLSRLIIRLSISWDSPSYDDLLRNLSTIIAGHDGLSIWQLKTVSTALDSAETILQGAFLALSVMAMSLCGFSLITSLLASALENLKETSTLRAIGLREWWLVRVNFIEAFSLLSASSIVGILQGWLLAVVQAQQQVVFLDLNQPWIFPTGLAITLLIVSILSAGIGSIVISPIGARSITSELRTM